MASAPFILSFERRRAQLPILHTDKKIDWVPKVLECSRALEDTIYRALVEKNASPPGAVVSCLATGGPRLWLGQVLLVR